MPNLDSNDDVFADDDDDNNGPSESSTIGQRKSININEGEVPGYLVDAVERYIRETGGAGLSGHDHIGVPFSAQVFNKINRLTSTVYTPDSLNIANAAMWKTLNHMSNGTLQLEFEKSTYENEIVGYTALSKLINDIYISIQEYENVEDYDETHAIAQQLLVYFDILNFHHDYAVENYYTFCQLNEIKPDEAVSKKNSFDTIYPFLTENMTLYGISVEDDDTSDEALVKRNVKTLFGSIYEEITKALKIGILAYDEIKKKTK